MMDPDVARQLLTAICTGRDSCAGCHVLGNGLAHGVCETCTGKDAQGRIPSDKEYTGPVDWVHLKGMEEPPAPAPTAETPEEHWRRVFAKMNPWCQRLLAVFAEAGVYASWGLLESLFAGCLCSVIWSNAAGRLGLPPVKVGVFSAAWAGFAGLRLLNAGRALGPWTAERRGLLISVAGVFGVALLLLRLLG
jgi:hypothetical protein